VEIVMVRHAQPAWEPGGRAVDDPGLTELGHRQASCAAKALEGEKFDAIYRSPLQRVTETAAPIEQTLGMRAEVEPWLRELGLPSLAGQTSEQVQKYFSDAHARDLTHWWDGLPGGESFRHFYERVTSGLEGLLAGQHRVGVHEDVGQRLWRIPDELQRILIVAHEGTNAVLLSHLLGVEPVPWAFMRFSSAWSGISHVHSVDTRNGAIWVLESFNRVSHLDTLGEPETGDGRSTPARAASIDS
jgi:probable phosphoglycerate mutase